MRFVLTALALPALLATTASLAQQSTDLSHDSPAWNDILASAEGQIVHWYAWAGDDRINAYIAWAAADLNSRYGIRVEQVPVTDTAEVVNLVRTEVLAGRDETGSVDLVWINGENFAAMKRDGLLHAPWTQALPNLPLVDAEGKPSTQTDFSEPVNHQESPWGMAQFNFIYDAAVVADFPADISALAAWAQANPSRFTYPQPPNFLGTTFLKQALYELTDAPDLLRLPAEESDIDAVTAPLWDYLDALHPHLWQQGQRFPANGPAAQALFQEGALDMLLSFFPTEGAGLVLEGSFPSSTAVAGFAGGTIGNTHFLAIPVNAEDAEGAMVLANFLLSPEAQARKQDPAVWGDGTVLNLQKLDAEAQARFEALPAQARIDIGPTLLEPHASWVEVLEAGWMERYGR